MPDFEGNKEFFKLVCHKQDGQTEEKTLERRGVGLLVPLLGMEDSLVISYTTLFRDRVRLGGELHSEGLLMIAEPDVERRYGIFG